MDIPRYFDKLTHEQLMRFAKARFDAYWDLVDKLKASRKLNSTMQHISKDVIELQKLINKQNQKILKNYEQIHNSLHPRANQEGS